MTPDTTDRRRDLHEQRFNRIEGKLDDIGQSLVILARIDERHIGIGENLVKVLDTQLQQGARLVTLERLVPDKLTQRLNAIESAMPGLKETRSWVVAGVLGGVSLMGVALASLVLR